MDEFSYAPAEVVEEVLSRGAERKVREQALPELTQEEAAQEKEQGRRDRNIKR